MAISATRLADLKIYLLVVKVWDTFSQKVMFLVRQSLRQATFWAIFGRFFSKKNNLVNLIAKVLACLLYPSAVEMVPLGELGFEQFGCKVLFNTFTRVFQIKPFYFYLVNH
jgi:hypothetical protein